MHDPWDGRPSFAKLPPEVREQVVGALPKRPNEITARVMLFRRVPNLNYPRGRLLVSAFQEDTYDASKPPKGAQIDAMDPNGRIPLSSIVIGTKDIVPVMENLIRAFLASGGSESDIANLIEKARKPLQSMGLTTYYEDEGSRD